MQGISHEMDNERVKNTECSIDRSIADEIQEETRPLNIQEDDETNKASQLIGKKRRRGGGRSTNGSEEFVIIDSQEPKRVRYMCCKETMLSVAWNSNSALKHLLECKRFCLNNPLGYETLVSKHQGNDNQSSVSTKRSQ